MKFPQFAVFTILIVCAIPNYSQTKSLATFSNGFYFEKGTLSIKATLDTDAHKKLFEALKVAELEDILDLSGPFTVFAPTNKAFSKFSNEEWEDLLLAKNRKKLKDMLTYHIVAGNLTASKILRALCRGEGRASFTTVQGNKIHATLQGSDIVLMDGSGNQAFITAADAGQSNGVIHQIDSVILPPGI